MKNKKQKVTRLTIIMGIMAQILMPFYAFAALSPFVQVQSDLIKPMVLHQDGSLTYLGLNGIDESRIITEIGTDNVSLFGANGVFYVLKANGDVWSASTGETGIAGRGSYTQTSEESDRVSNWGKISQLSGVKKVITDGSKSYAIDGNNNLWAWGNPVDYWTQDGFVINSNVPINYSGKTLETGSFPNNIADIDKYIALTADNNIYTWSVTSLPTLVTGMPSGIIFNKVFSSDGTFFAISDQNILYSWGVNNNGQMLDGSTNNTPSTTPTLADQTGLPNGEYFVKIVNNSVGSIFGLTNLKNVYAWGRNTQSGLLGLNTNNDYVGASGALIINELSGTEFISSRNLSMFAIKDDGNVYVWGAELTPAENVPKVYTGDYNLDGIPAQTPLPKAGFQFLFVLVPISLLSAFTITRKVGKRA